MFGLRSVLWLRVVIGFTLSLARFDGDAHGTLFVFLAIFSSSIFLSMVKSYRRAVVKCHVSPDSDADSCIPVLVLET